MRISSFFRASRHPLLVFLLTALVGGGAVGRAETASQRADHAGRLIEQQQTSIQRAYGSLRLSFVANAGQAAQPTRYLAQGSGYRLAFTRSGVKLGFLQKQNPLALDLRFLGANADVAVEGRQQLAGKVSYLLGSDPAAWRRDLSTYGKVVYRNLWPGVDMVFMGDNSQLKYAFMLRPGARVSDIGLAYRGIKDLALASTGSLKIRTSRGVLTDTRPVSYQVIDGERVPVESRFDLRGGGAYGLAVGHYDARRPLVIDPGLVYSTFLGGTNADAGMGIAVDSSGNAYVTGSTLSSDFPHPVGYDTSFNGNQDVFVTKLNASGTALVYSTFIGGSTNDIGNAIAVDSLGSAYMTGSTGGGYPIQSGLTGFTAWQPFYAGGSTDAFVTKLSPSGTTLMFSTYAGGSGADQGWGIAVHSSTDVYVTGDTTSTNFPHTATALQATRSGNSDGFFLRLDRFAAGAGYSSYVGGNADDSARAIAIDANRNVFLTGDTTSTNFATSGSFDMIYGGAGDAFVRKLAFVSSVGGNDTYAIGYSTYLGGGGQDRGLGIAIDTGGNAYTTGLTASSGGTPFPTTVGAVQTTFQGGAFDAYATKLNASGAALAYSTYLGGSGDDRGQGIALDGAGVASLTGRTASANFPTTSGAFDTSWNGGDDAFVTKLGAGGSLLYSTFLGGSSGGAGNNDRGLAIALDGSGTYLTGSANSSNFPTTAGAYDTTQNGNSDAFVTKLITVGTPYALTLTPPTATNQVGTSHTVTATVTDFGGQPVSGVTVRFSVTGANPRSGSSATNASGQATFTYTGTVAGLDTINAYADTNNNTTRDTGEPSGTATKLWTAGPAATLTLTPPTATNTVGTMHCVTATVRDAFGNPVPGVTVRFSVPTSVATHASPSSGSAATNSAGQAQFCYSAALPGEDVIYAFADTNGNTTQDAGEPFGTAAKTWTVPASTEFCEVTVTNGGWIIADNGDRANFGGNARVSADGSSVQGQEEYHDQGPVQPLNVHSLSLTATTCSSDMMSATIFGTATIDGSGNHVFRIDVTDMGSPGTNDTYGIILDTGYVSGQRTLQGGNVTIHRS